MPVRLSDEVIGVVVVDSTTSFQDVRTQIVENFSIDSFVFVVLGGRLEARTNIKMYSIQ